MSGGGGDTQTSSSGPPQWIQDYGQQYLGAASQVAQQPWQPYGQQRVANLSPTTQYGIQGISGLAGGNQNLDDAQGMLSETLRGGGMNPYLEGMTDRITGDARNAYNQSTGAITARFNRPGSFAGSAHLGQQDQNDTNFARGLTDGLSQLHAGAYENERNRQMQAVGASTGLYDSLGRGYQNAIGAGDVERGQNQNLLDSLYGEWQDYQNHPQRQLGIFGSALGGAMGSGGQQQTTQLPGRDPVATGIGMMQLGNMFRGSGSSASGGK